MDVRLDCCFQKIVEALAGPQDFVDRETTHSVDRAMKVKELVGTNLRGYYYSGTHFDTNSQSDRIQMQGFFVAGNLELTIAAGSSDLSGETLRQALRAIQSIVLKNSED